MEEEMKNGKQTRVKIEDLDDLCGYSDSVQSIIMDYLHEYPDVMLPGSAILMLLKVVATNMHINHSPLLRPLHDARWQKKHGATRVYPAGGGYVPYKDENDENDD